MWEVTELIHVKCSGERLMLELLIPTYLFSVMVTVLSPVHVTRFWKSLNQRFSYNTFQLNWRWLRPWTPYCQIRLKLKKVGETTRPLRYDLNQIPYNYTVDMTNRFKGLDLIDRVPEELWTKVHDIVREAGIKTIPLKEMLKGKMVVWGGHTNSWEKKRS